MPLSSDKRLYINHLENDATKLRILQAGHHEAHKLICTAGGTIDDKVVKKLKLTPELLANAEAPLSRDELDKLRNKSVKPSELAKR